MSDSVWISDREAVAINARAVDLFGGLQAGVRDETLFQAALARPLNKWHYEEPLPDIFDLAAAYAFALCKGHVFHDGKSVHRTLSLRSSSTTMAGSTTRRRSRSCRR